jgi:hypothetical protein
MIRATTSIGRKRLWRPPLGKNAVSWSLLGQEVVACLVVWLATFGVGFMLFLKGSSFFGFLLIVCSFVFAFLVTRKLYRLRVLAKGRTSYLWDVFARIGIAQTRRGYVQPALAVTLLRGRGRGHGHPFKTGSSIVGRNICGCGSVIGAGNALVLAHEARMAPVDGSRRSVAGRPVDKTL